MGWSPGMSVRSRRSTHNTRRTSGATPSPPEDRTPHHDLPRPTRLDPTSGTESLSVGDGRRGPGFGLYQILKTAYHTVLVTRS